MSGFGEAVLVVSDLMGGFGGDFKGAVLVGGGFMSGYSERF